MKKIVVISFLFSFFLVCCGQSKPETKSMETEITKDNIVDKVFQKVKHYPEEPMYYIYVHNSLCLYEMLVNDYPIEKRFEYSTSGTPFYINTAILKSGKQKLTFRIYPAPKEYNKDSEVLSQFAKLSFEILVNDRVTGLKIANEKKVLEGEAPQIKAEGYSGGQYFAGMGQKYYEYSIEFEAKVPYELESWTAGEDLRKFDQKKLEEKVFSFYNNYKNNYNEENIDKIIKKSYLALIADAVPDYYGIADIREQWDQSLETIRMKKDWYPWNYKMVFNGDGRIVALLQKDESIDYLRNISAIAFKYKLGKEEGMIYTNLYLYIPKGGTIEDLQVLR